MTVSTLNVQRRAARSRHAALSRARRDYTRRVELDAVRRAAFEEVVADYWGGTAAPPVPAPPKPHRTLYGRCRAGHEPAEALPTKERELLVAEFCTAGWTDRQIAEHTRMTLYTTARVRARLGLSPNFGPGEVST